MSTDSSVSSASPQIEATVGCLKFSKQDLLDSTDNYSESKKVGLGAYGTVYRGELRSSSVAIKLLSTVRTDVCNLILIAIVNMYSYRLLLKLLGV